MRNTPDVQFILWPSVENSVLDFVAGSLSVVDVALQFSGPVFEVDWATSTESADYIKSSMHLTNQQSNQSRIEDLIHTTVFF